VSLYSVKIINFTDWDLVQNRPGVDASTNEGVVRLAMQDTLNRKIIFLWQKSKHPLNQ
jgi:hypothetical protein